MATHQIYPHGPLIELLPGVWYVRGGQSLPLSRNMVVVRLASGEILLHSVVALGDEGMKTLEALGPLAYAIIPSKSHQKDAPFYKDRYPQLRTMCVGAVRSGIEIAVDFTVEEILPRLGLVIHPVPATKAIENIYEFVMPAGGRMLMANDVLGNTGAGANGFVGRELVNRLWVPLGGGPDIGRVYRWMLARDVRAIRRFLAALGNLPDLRLVTVSHGDPITEAPAEKLRALADNP